MTAKELHITHSREEAEFLYLEPAAAKEVSNFVPRKIELLQIVKCWHKVILRNNWFSFTTGSWSSSEGSENCFAEARIADIEDLIESDDVTRATLEAEEEFSANLNPRHWEIFKCGDKTQRDALWEELEQAKSGPRSRRSVPTRIQ